MALPRRYRRLLADRPAVAALAALTLGLFLLWPAVDVWIRTLDVGTEYAYYDYGAYSGAIDRWFQGGLIYQPAEEGGYHGSYLYPPITLLAFLPLYPLDFHVAGTLLGVGSVLLLWLGVTGVAATAGYRLRRWERLVLLGALFGFQPLLFSLKMGQVPILLTGVLCLAYVAGEVDADDGRGEVDADGNRGDAAPAAVGRLHRLGAWPYVSGALTTLGSSMKLHYAPSGAHMLRDRRRLVGGLATAVGLALASVAVFGIEVHLNYLDVLAWGKGWGTSPRPPELWMPAYYRPLYVLGALSLPIRGLVVLGVIGLSLLGRRAGDATTRRATFALGVAVVPLVAPKAYTQDLVILLLPAAILLGIELTRDGGWPGVPVLAVLLLHIHSFGLHLFVDSPGWLPLGDALPAAAGWLQPGLWGTVLLIGLATARVGAGVRAVRSGDAGGADTA